MAINFPNSPVVDEVFAVVGGPTWQYTGTTWKLLRAVTDDGAAIVTYTPPGTGAVTTTVAARLDETISVKDFGATGDGVTDDAAAIQAAIDAAELTNAKVFVPPGTYLVGTTLTITTPITLEGVGWGSIIKTNQATGDVIQVTTVAAYPGAIIQSLSIDTSVTRTADYYIHSISAEGTKIRDVRMDSPFHGIGFTGIAVNHLEVSDLYIETLNAAGTGINYAGQSGLQGSVYGFFKNLSIKGTSGTNAGVGISIPSCGDLSISGFHTGHCDIGIEISPAAGARVQALHLQDGFLDSGSSNGIKIAPTSTGSVQYLRAVNVWIATNGADGINISSTGTVKDASFVNCTSSNNSANGIYINNSGADGVSIIGCYFSANGNSGLAVAAGVTDFKIVDCTIGEHGQFGVNVLWGISIAGGASDRYIITGNNFTGNTSGTLDDGGTGTAKTIRGNLGYNTDFSVNVKELGALGDGTTDDTVAIQAAITASEAAAATFGAGSVYFPPGLYRITGELVVTKNTRLYGSGMGSCINVEHTTGDGIRITSAIINAPGCSIEHLFLRATGVRTADYMIHSESAQGTKISDVRIDSAWNAIGVTGAGTVSEILIKDCGIHSLLNIGIDITAATGTQGIVASKIDNVLIDGTGGTPGVIGVNVTSAGDLSIAGVGTGSVATGLKLQPATGAVVQYMAISNCIFDNGTANGIHIVPDSGGKVHAITFDQIWSATFGANGCLIAGAGEVNGVRFTNSTIGNNTLAGVSITNAGTIGTAYHSGILGQNGTDGFVVAANVDDFSLIGNTIGATGQWTGNTGYGVRVTSGTSDNYVIQGNTFLSNTAGAFLDASTGLTKDTSGNIGAGGSLRTYAVPSAEWGLDMTSSAVISLAQGDGSVSYTLSPGSGLVMLHDETTGQLGLFLTGGGAVILVAQTSSIFVTGTTPGAAEISLGFSTDYVIENGFTSGGTRDVWISTIRTRKAS